MGWSDSEFSWALSRKYAQGQQAVDADSARARAALVGAQGAADAATAQAERTRAEIPYVGPLSMAEVAQRRATANLSDAQANTTHAVLSRMSSPGIDKNYDFLPWDNNKLGTAWQPSSTALPDFTYKPTSSLSNVTKPGASSSYYVGPARIDEYSEEKRKAKGETKVPGKGSGKVDKVPRLLAPGEAILNKAAAEFLGRGMIRKLNSMGAKKMGMR